MLVKAMANTLIRYQSSSSMAKRLKQNTSNSLNFLKKGFKSREEQIDACESEHLGLNSLSTIKLYSLTVKTKCSQHARPSIERVRIP